MSDPDTIAYYQKEAQQYARAFGPGPNRDLDSFLDQLPCGAKILELGCGAGNDTARMIERGFEVHPTDGTPAMAKIASQRLNRTVRIMLFEELDDERKYHAVWANACLLHVPRAELSDILRRIHHALRLGGLHFANYKIGDGEGRDLLGRLGNFPEPSWIEDIYRSAGFAIAKTEVYKGKGADGTVRDWFALTVQKN